MSYLVHAVILGIGATLLMDLWGVVRGPLFGFAPLDYAMLGRWFGAMARGRFRHEAIARSPRVPAERVIGVAGHYLTGITLAGLLLLLTGPTWLHRPTLGAPLLFGVATVVAPLLIMQPAMGAGIAAANTPRPGTARLQSLLSHALYGLGLYLAGWLDQLLFT